MKIKLSNDVVMNFPVITLGDVELREKSELIKKLGVEMSKLKDEDPKVMELYEELDKRRDDFLQTAFSKADYKKIPLCDQDNVCFGLINGRASMDAEYKNFTEDVPPAG